MTAEVVGQGGRVRPDEERPLVSIVVCMYNHVELTCRCLDSVQAVTPAGCYELILVDDGSEDPEAASLGRRPQTTLVRSEVNLGFTGAANLGASHARGQFLVFLNNDTEVQPGWLEWMLDAANDGPDVAAVGVMLLEPDGLVQEAGGVVWSDASASKFGRRGSPDDPVYRYRREVDYCSGACLLVPRELFEEIGGFDDALSPGFYDDTDLCMSLRRSGRVVLYEPSARVVHQEGATFGTEHGSGASRRHTKAAQHLNRYRFQAKWAEELLRHHPHGTSGGLRGGRRPDRPRVLVCDHVVPSPDRDSGSLRMSWILLLLHSIGCEVTFYPLLHAGGQMNVDRRPYARWLRRAGIEVREPASDLEELGGQRPGFYDLVVASRPSVSTVVRDPVCRWFPQATFVYDAVDLHFLREERHMALRRALPAEVHEHRRLRRLELDQVGAADVVSVVTDSERAVLAELVPQATIVTLPNVHAGRRSPVPPAPGRCGMVFLGGYGHTPNVDAVRWFVSDVLPMLELRPGETFRVLGDDPPPELRSLASATVEVTGYVPEPELAACFDSARVFVAPLRFGAGMKGKIGHAMSLGLPVVTTAIGAEGMGLVDGVTAMLADDAAQFAEAVNRLRADDGLWHKLSSQSQEWARAHWSPDQMRNRLRDLVALAVPARQLVPRNWGHSETLGDFDGAMRMFADG